MAADAIDFREDERNREALATVDWYKQVSGFPAGVTLDRTVLKVTGAMFAVTRAGSQPALCPHRYGHPAAGEKPDAAAPLLDYRMNGGLKRAALYDTTRTGHRYRRLSGEQCLALARQGRSLQLTGCCRLELAADTDPAGVAAAVCQVAEHVGWEQGVVVLGLPCRDSACATSTLPFKDAQHHPDPAV